MRTSRVLLTAMGLSWLAGCAVAAPPAAPRHATVDQDRQVERDQQELERRRSHLQKQVLSDLNDLRQRRQASTSGAASAGDDDAASSDCQLLVFGGETHEVFLGCLAEEQRPDSVFNMVGEHGSELSPTSIRNKFAPYGSNHDDTSACNAAATHPPLVISSEGKSLGLLTTNPSLKRRIDASSVSDWLTRMCGY